MNNVVYQENRLCPNILGHIYIWKIVKLSDFMFLQGGGTPQSNTQFVILQVRRRCALCGISRKYVVTNHFRSYI